MSTKHDHTQPAKQYRNKPKGQQPPATLTRWDKMRAHKLFPTALTLTTLTVVGAYFVGLSVVEQATNIVFVNALTYLLVIVWVYRTRKHTPQFGWLWLALFVAPTVYLMEPLLYLLVGVTTLLTITLHRIFRR